MNRDITEIKLLTIRQRCRDALCYFGQQSVLPMEKFLYLKEKLEVCNEMISFYRDLKQRKAYGESLGQAS